MPDVVMPRLSDSMEEGTIIKWLKADGDEIARGDELVEIETDKANMVYEADAAGTLKIVAQEGDTLPIGEPIAQLGDGSAPAESKDEPKAEAKSESKQAEASSGSSEGGSGDEGKAAQATAAPAGGDDEPAAQAAPSGSDNGRVKASPVARRLARELGVDLQGISGSGPGGRIVKADVQSAADNGGAQAEETQAPSAEAAPAEQAKPAAEEKTAAEAKPEKEIPGPVVSGDAGSGKGEVQTIELTRTQQTIARRMAESRATIPDYTVTTEVDMEQAVALREQLKKSATESMRAPSFNDMVVKAAALALREYPRVNGAYKDGKWELYSRINVGIAVAIEGALIVPTVFDADRKAIGQIGREARDLATRVRAGRITPPELSAGTFTVSNLGMFGTTEFTAVINPGQAAIMAVGALRDVPVVRDGEVVPGRRMSITLCSDHRIVNGAEAAQFLARVRELLESPFALAF